MGAMGRVNAPIQDQRGGRAAGPMAGAVLAALVAGAVALGAPVATQAAQPGQIAAAEATGWRLGEHDAMQRLVIDLTRPVEFLTNSCPPSPVKSEGRDTSRAM